MNKQKYTNSELTEIAMNHGYWKKGGQLCHGQAIFTNGKYFISHDVDQHNGGFWKKATSIRNLGSNKRRLGTYEEDPKIRKCD